MIRRPGVMPLLIALLYPAASVLAAEEEGLWSALQTPGHALLLRHANAPGTGDPADFALGDCSTQRNLDEEGRRQARRLGARLRERGVQDRTVYTSRWCRCSETAELLDAGPVEPLTGLNSFFGEAFSRDEIMPQLREFLRTNALDPPPVLVTHQVNITSLTGVFPREGEMVVIEVDGDGSVDVVGRIPPDN